MISKKIYIAVVGTALAVTSALAFSVFADEMRGKSMEKKQMHVAENLLNRLEKFDEKEFTFSKESFERGAPATLTINPRGHARITGGTVTAVASDIVTVDIWKIAFSVHKMPDTKVFAGGKRELTFEQIAVGDRVDVVGQLDEMKSGFIHAKSVHDRTQISRTNEDERGRLQKLIDELLKRLRELRGELPPLTSPSPSLSPSPTSSPSPSPSVSPSLSPSVSPSPSASPSSSPSPSTS